MTALASDFECVGELTIEDGEFRVNGQPLPLPPEPTCDGPETCHGPVRWCPNCGDVGGMCSIVVLRDGETHRCDVPGHRARVLTHLDSRVSMRQLWLLNLEPMLVQNIRL